MAHIACGSWNLEGEYGIGDEACADSIDREM
jgi:hypothetical protein